jgi:hypothetical protein
MARKLTPRKHRLFNVCWAARMIIWKAQQASKTSVVGMPAVMYINRRELGNTTSEKPLNAQQTGKMMVKYSNVWLEIIVYVWWTHELPVVKPSDSKEEVEGKRPPYHFSARQYVCIERMKMAAGHDREEDWLDGIASDDDDDDDDRLDEEQDEAFVSLIPGIVVVGARIKSMVLHGWGWRYANMGGTRTWAAREHGGHVHKHCT